MKVNSVMGLLLAVESGVGLAALPEYLVSNSTNVIKVLPKSEGPITEAHFVYPQSLKNTARVQAFRNFLFSKIGDWKQSFPLKNQINFKLIKNYFTSASIYAIDNHSH